VDTARVWLIPSLSYQAQGVDAACVARYLRISVATRARAHIVVDTECQCINPVLGRFGLGLRRMNLRDEELQKSCYA